jgi:hypothetical protein
MLHRGKGIGGIRHRRGRLVVEHIRNRFHKLVYSERLRQVCLEARFEDSRAIYPRNQGGHRNDWYTTGIVKRFSEESDGTLGEGNFFRPTLWNLLSYAVAAECQHWP